MAKRIYPSVMRVGRATVFAVGLAVILAVVLGVATVALAAVPGDPLKLGKVNAINKAITTLAGTNAGKAMLVVDNNSNAAGSRALDLKVQPGRAPLAVNPDAGKAPNFNADEEDGLSAGQIRGARAYARVTVVQSGVILTPSLTNGFTAVVRQSTGTYCLTPAPGIDEDERPSVVSVYWNSTASPQGNASAMYYNNTVCPSPFDQFAVRTERQFIDGSGDLDSAPANDVSFTIVVP